ncbi:hypothetical protein [Liquorilactobacillus satsumensis]|uniref:hypothetical protein n=1 Tax=Liquorilactobacillus satsumensis TaxID=259059 RepID=UPI0039EB8E39
MNEKEATKFILEDIPSKLFIKLIYDAKGKFGSPPRKLSDGYKKLIINKMLRTSEIESVNKQLRNELNTMYKLEDDKKEPKEKEKIYKAFIKQDYNKITELSKIEKDKKQVVDVEVKHCKTKENENNTEYEKEINMLNNKLRDVKKRAEISFSDSQRTIDKNNKLNKECATLKKKLKEYSSLNNSYNDYVKKLEEKVKSLVDRQNGDSVYIKKLKQQNSILASTNREIRTENEKLVKKSKDRYSEVENNESDKAEQYCLIIGFPENMGESVIGNRNVDIIIPEILANSTDVKKSYEKVQDIERIVTHKYSFYDVIYLYTPMLPEADIFDIKRYLTANKIREFSDIDMLRREIK